ncbi:MAG: YegP family protein [Prolixibacteraceae bacterium]
MGKFEISKRKDANFMFNLKASNGEIIMTSQGYTAKLSCQNGIESVKVNSVDRNMFIKEIASDGSFYFNLTAVNAQIIGTSQMYTSTQGRDNGIESVKENAAKAEVLDLTSN